MVEIFIMQVIYEWKKFRELITFLIRKSLNAMLYVWGVQCIIYSSETWVVKDGVKRLKDG